MLLDLIFALLVLAAAFCLPKRFLLPSRETPPPRDGCWLFRRTHRAILTVFGASLLLNVLFAL